MHVCCVANFGLFWPRMWPSGTSGGYTEQDGLRISVLDSIYFHPLILWKDNLIMPVSGLPTILETVIVKLMEESFLSSYKIAGNGGRSTIVLRFETTTMAATDTDGASSIHQSVPASCSYRRKAPCHYERDRRRRDQLLNPTRPTDQSQESTSMEETIPHNQDSTPTETNNIRVPPLQTSDCDSVLDSLSSTVVDSTTDKSISKDLRSDVNSLTPIKHCERKGKLTCTASENNSVSYDNNPRDECSKDTELNTLDQRSSDSNTTKNDNVENEKRSRDDSQREHTDLPTPRDIHQVSQSESDYTIQCNRFFDCDKLLQDTQQLNKRLKRHVTQLDRNNEYKKLWFDDQARVVLMETDDFIIEYNVLREKEKMD